MRLTFQPRLLGSTATAAGPRRTCSIRPFCRQRLHHHSQQRLTVSRPARPPSIRWQRAYSSSRPCLGPAQPAAAPSPPPPPPQPSKRRRAIVLGSLAVLVGGTVYWATAGSASGSFDDNGQRRLAAGGRGGLNTETFVSFAVVARDRVSPTAFVLTLRLLAEDGVARTATAAAIATAWQHGLWSVEVKQPQLQIARDYTPLPRVVGEHGEHGEHGQHSADGTEIRLFVRVVPGGEVSKYLSRRAVGSTVDVRGPRLSFDVAARMGGDGDSDRQVVVLAGGTGISTALQAAKAVLGRGAAVSILWANRQADDSIGVTATIDAKEANPIVRDIKALQTRYGADRLRVLSFVDAQQTWITEPAVRQAIAGPNGKSSGRSWYWPWGRQETTSSATTQPDTTDPSCVYHSARTLERLDADVFRGSTTTRTCSCGAGSAGKNLVLVSGPDGFIAAWAGAKTWAGGQEQQGPLGGILGHMAARDPETFARWQVLKL
ncbi:cytochrome c mitochondrial import factor [Sporothrix schenckii 1099-18]|uniref:Cytochrome c mitochondrial import factor n=1 Tax=Sporothrix schenckii 1099-18 TaxID=1397361 RepID=A0A0F2MA85_SPOSC|nr:cytochrome c mitochondrial import factor [Sporothrix schenckii 1099-18]KJR86608.1 cytochrome c mitochondrial import factor [Sporothrix schenckii 1099-18]